MKKLCKNGTLGKTLQPGVASLVRRRRAEQAGRSAEMAVAHLLETRGFTILGQRLRTAVGEIDIVAENGDLLVFVEVKLRTSMAAAAESVSPRQRRRLIGAAEILLATHEDWQRPATRFDVAFSLPGGITYLEDAFRADSP